MYLYLLSLRVCVCVCVCASLMLFGSVQADYKLVDTHLVHLCFEMLCDTQKLELEGALGMRLLTLAALNAGEIRALWG